MWVGWWPHDGWGMDCVELRWSDGLLGTRSRLGKVNLRIWHLLVQAVVGSRHLCWLRRHERGLVGHHRRGVADVRVHVCVHLLLVESALWTHWSALVVLSWSLDEGTWNDLGFHLDRHGVWQDLSRCLACERVLWGLHCCCWQLRAWDVAVSKPDHQQAWFCY